MRLKRTSAGVSTTSIESGRAVCGCVRISIPRRSGWRPHRGGSGLARRDAPRHRGYRVSVGWIFPLGEITSDVDNRPTRSGTRCTRKTQGAATEPVRVGDLLGAEGYFGPLWAMPARWTWSDSAGRT